MRTAVGALVVLLGCSTQAGAVQDPQVRPTFKAAVNRVTVAAIVRDRQGRPITTLKRDDFALLDSGEPRTIVEFRSEPTPVSMAVLADFSGSMDVAARRKAAQTVAFHLLSWLTPGEDEVGLYAFDRDLYELQPLAPAPGNVLQKLESLKPYGQTSLFDAIGRTSETLGAKGALRRAVVVLTDGADNASRLTPEAVTRIASAIEVPVYIVVVVSPLDLSEKSTVLEPEFDALLSGRLGDLARSTGGEIFVATTPSRTSQAARQIVTELRHQYWIAFEPDPRPGWHSIAIQTRKKDYVVRARSGYFVRERS